ncbi:RsmB/NOP family class I SAM-dependent RNA methyltransferase [Jiangella asiatica]|uniref:rRNA cytosine-C5-methyltransferase n=1 Tax=Jiangella asiatica TaxID=2530372 RepID=A0A4R5CJ54_9ACTN|nr:transcription antitermination factor NusB [Jiangella asiatica]TDE00252.1 rRNA cytosine-C5-methyltransferase [Jiangella asiatica]
MTDRSPDDRRGRRRAPRRTDPPGRRRDARAPSRQTPPRRDPAREAAFEVLRAVAADDAYANLVMPTTLRRHDLTGRDAALATELAYGALRGQGTYDAVIGACVTRPLAGLDPPLLDALRLGAHQLLSTRVPPHAAVSTTVDLVRAHVNVGAARLANAVLRRVGEHDLDDWAARLAPRRGDTDAVDHLAFRHAHPAWIVRALRDALPGDDELEACLAADNAPAEVHLAARPGRATVDELLAAGARPAQWSPYGVVVEAGMPARFAAVREGRAGVQDEGSQLVALALAAAPLDGPDERWLDLCAGPGGKAALLAGLATERGARLLAVEQHEHRARLVAQALAGDPGEHEVLVGDATEPAWPEADFDRVLLDAPCTGLGALRRRPEARWRRRPDDLARLRELQVALLGSAIRSVRPGGLVAYVTCSPHLAETATVVDDVLGARADAERVDARPYLPGVPDLGAGPDVQLWPHRHGTDAMYLALLRRTG